MDGKAVFIDFAIFQGNGLAADPTELAGSFHGLPPFPLHKTVGPTTEDV